MRSFIEIIILGHTKEILILIGVQKTIDGIARRARGMTITRWKDIVSKALKAML